MTALFKGYNDPERTTTAEKDPERGNRFI